MEFNDIHIEKLNHAAFKLKEDKIIYIDVFKIPPQREKADIVLITHEHFDHLSLEDMKKVVTEKTAVVCAQQCEAEVKRLNAKNVKVLFPGDTCTKGEIIITATESYNTNKFRAPGVVFHPKEDRKLGYIIQLDKTRIYHAGDTDVINEMKTFGRIDVALLPVSGTYVMTPEEAAQAAEIIKPKIAVPMHWGSIVGTRADAEKFKGMAPCESEIL